MREGADEVINGRLASEIIAALPDRVHLAAAEWMALNRSTFDPIPTSS